MSINRTLLIAAIVLFALVALSAFTTALSVNETGFLALGLTAYAASQLTFNVAPLGPRRGRGRVLG